MRRILPSPSQDVDAASLVAEEERTPHRDRPWVALNMITTVDGSVVASNGRSGPLGGGADRAMFRALRGEADVIMAGATTVRIEDYGAPQLPPGVQARRTAERRPPLPRLAVVCGTLDLDPQARLFREAAADQPPLIVTSASSTRAHAVRAARLEEVATLVRSGEQTLDLTAALALLAGKFATRVLLVEGGPSLNGQLLAADLVDELCLTISPALAGSHPLGLTSGPPTGPRPLHLVRVAEEDGFLLLRYLRRPEGKTFSGSAS